jgi:hypothetical protein
MHWSVMGVPMFSTAPLIMIHVHATTQPMDMLDEDVYVYGNQNVLMKSQWDWLNSALDFNIVLRMKFTGLTQQTGFCFLGLFFNLAVEGLHKSCHCMTVCNAQFNELQILQLILHVLYSWHCSGDPLLDYIVSGIAITDFFEVVNKYHTDNWIECLVTMYQPQSEEEDVLGQLKKID